MATRGKRHRARKSKLSFNTKMFILVVIILAAVVMLSGTPEVAKFSAALTPKISSGSQPITQPLFINIGTVSPSVTKVMSPTEFQALLTGAYWDSCDFLWANQQIITTTTFDQVGSDSKNFKTTFWPSQTGTYTMQLNCPGGNGPLGWGFRGPVTNVIVKPDTQTPTISIGTNILNPTTTDKVVFTATITDDAPIMAGVNINVDGKMIKACTIKDYSSTTTETCVSDPITLSVGTHTYDGIIVDFTNKKGVTGTKTITVKQAPPTTLPGGVIKGGIS